MTQILNNFFKKVINRYRRHRDAQQTINELSKLSTRELNDIGLARGDIWYVAHQDAAERYEDKVDAVYANPNLRGFV